MIVHTNLLAPDGTYDNPELGFKNRLSDSANYQTYCGLDCCLTLEIFQELCSQFTPPHIYSFERALQAPYLAIMQRGFAVDETSRRRASGQLRNRLGELESRLNLMAQAIWQKPLNPRSPAQLKDFFYQTMKLPEVILSQKGVRKVSTNREALEKLDVYLYARPFISCILAMRDIGKQLTVLETEVDPDGRFRASYNIAGTETGRPSSSTNAFGTGGNAQNIAAPLRYIFVADSGWKLCVIDLEQVEARDVGFFCGCLFEDWKFLDNCESGDLHTNNCKLIWPEKQWTNDPSLDKELAEENFYRDYSFRDMSKRGGHLSNYMGTAYTAARSLKVPIGIMDEFQARYCRGRTGDPRRGLSAVEPAFPAIPKYWQWIAQQLQTTHKLITPFGRERHFFGRPDDDTTLREAIAFLPQSTTADRMNKGMLNLWHQMPQVQLLAQTYDSVTFQYRETEDESSLIPEALAALEVTLVSPSGRRFLVPGEAKVGWNWAKAHDPSKPTGPRNLLNPDGLVKWKHGKPDKRRRLTALQRVAI